jgi:hypothetical protein
MRREAITLVLAIFVGTLLTAEERREGAVPVQGEVDPKEPAQRQDFEQKK